jgi:Ca2+-transporting ATPase
MAALDVVHACVAGRLRVHLAALIDNPDLIDKLSAALRQRREIRSSRASSITGNLLVEYDPQESQTTILEIIDGAIADSATPLRPSVAWWTLSEEQALQQLNTSRTGLSSDAVAERSHDNAHTVQRPIAPTHPLTLLGGQFNSLPIILLSASALVSVATGGLLDAALVGGVIVANVVIGYVTERNAERIIHSFIKEDEQRALALRDGQPREVSRDELVPGDVLVLTPGTILPADVRIIESNGLTIDESILTGESMASSKIASTLVDPSTALPDRANMAYSGTFVTGGNGIAAVVATGYASEVGRINLAVASTRRAATPMQRQINQLGGQLTMASVMCSAALFGLGWWYELPLSELIRRSAALAVAAIPEGLPTVTTSILATGMQDMKRHGVLIRSLNAVETLGSVDVICFDKTGTLTRNQMQVTSIRIDSEQIDVRNNRFVYDDEPIDPNTHSGLMDLLRVGVLCNESVLSGATAYIVNGSSTENALLLAAMRAGLDVVHLRQEYPLRDVEYRTETRRYMRTVHEVDGERRITAIKGNPLDVLALCRSRRDEETEHPLDDRYLAQIADDNAEMANAGLRVLGFAYAQDDDPPIWLGMVGMTDPARPEMAAVVEQFHRAGIRTIMVTGDQAGTALAVARDIALAPTISVYDCAVAPAADIPASADATDVFARISPLHKLDVVRALQDQRHIVAMTGDGVNDGPALRAADIGITFGTTGTDAARTIADVVLAEDDLATMIIAVERGRTIYDNLHKAISFMVGTNSSEVMLTLAAAAVGAGQPLNTAQLLWINLVTDVAIAYSLGFEPPESDVLNKPPRAVDTPIIGRDDYRQLFVKGGLISGTAFATHLYGLARYGANGGGIAMSTLIAAQLLEGFSSRSRQRRVWDLPINPRLTASIFGLFGLQTLVSVIPLTRQMLGIEALDLLDLAVIAGGAGGQFLFSELITKRARDLPATNNV